MLSGPDQSTALDLAVTAIVRALRTGHRWVPPVEDLSPALRAHGAAFVTLRRHGDLRGCIGSLTAYQPLGVDIARHAFDAAFADPRFPPVVESEVAGLDVDISVLTAPQPVAATDWQELLRVVRPGVDGLIVESGPQRGTFLPAVWESLPDPADFLDGLWRKAGLRPRTWSADISVSRYAAEEFGGPARRHGPLAVQRT